jgi:hypothetical protein
MKTMNESVVEADNFTLGDDDVAIVLTPDSVRLVTPKKDDDELVSANVQFAVMLAYLASTDSEWVQDTIDRFEEQTDE